MRPQIRNKAIVLFIILLLATIGISLNRAHVHSAHQNELLKQKKELAEKALKGFRDERVHVHFDKSFYQPGDDIWFQAYLLDEVTMKPSDISDFVHVQLLNPQGAVESEVKLLVRKGSGSGDFALSSESSGGIYKVRAYSEWQKNDTSSLLFEKELQVQAVVLPHLKMKLDFDKKSYDGGEVAEADLSLEQNDNRPLAFHPFKYVVYAEGIKMFEGEGSTGNEGLATVSYELPKQLEAKQWLVNVLLEYEGSRESISRAIPISQKEVAITFYPEGGELVQNLNNRVAFKATNAKGKTVEVAGYIQDKSGRKVAEFESFHEGMGSFELRPNKSMEYEAVVTSPKGVAKAIALPESIAASTSLRVESMGQEHFKLLVESSQRQELSVVGMLRGKVYYTGAIHAQEGSNELLVPQNDFPMGIGRFTVFNSQGTILAERLVFANYEGGLQVTITTDKEQYAPREEVILNIQTSTKEGKPVATRLSLSVVDDQLLSFADDKQSNILGKLLLEPELRGKVKEAGFYFDHTEAKAKEALDLLLLTRGWRKFSWKSIEQPNISVYHLPEQAIYGAYLVDRWDKTAIEGVSVQVQGTELKAETDQTGFFQFHALDLSKGPVQLVFEKEGYDALSARVFTYNTHQYFYLNDKEKEAKHRARVDLIEREDILLMEGVQRASRMEARNANAFAVQVVNEDVDEVRVEDAGGELEVDFDMQGEEVLLEKVAEREKEVVVVNQPLGLMDSIRQGNFRLKKEVRGDKWKDFQQRGTPFYQARIFPEPQYAKDEIVEERTHFNSTVYWKGNVETDAGGEAEIRFFNNDLISSFKIQVEGLSAEGQLASASAKYFTQLPFNMRVKIPVTASFGDRIEIPLTIKNNTQQSFTGQLRVQHGEGLIPIEVLPNKVTVKGFQTMTYYIPFEVGTLAGPAKLALSFTGEGVRDALSKEVLISAKGFPQHLSFAGQQMVQRFDVNITAPIEGSVKASLKAYPSLTEEILAGIESILREPSGCFEQTSSSTYPNIMVMQYLRETGKNDSDVAAKASGMIDRGYKRLTSYETSEKGYEWFGSNPPHEALTAYGLMEFVDMKEVYGEVSEDMLQRTTAFLLKRRDGKGGFLRAQKALDRFGRASEAVTNAYIVWALTEAGVSDVQQEYKMAKKNASNEKDAYELGLATLSAFNLSNNEDGHQLLSLLKEKQNEDGSFDGAQSITMSGGISLKIEATSLAILAMLKAETPDKAALNKALEFIVNNRSFGGYGSTQGTVLALKALTAFTKSNKKTDEAGTVSLLVDRKKVQTLHYEAGAKGEIVFKDFAALLEKGKHRVEIQFSNTSEALPYALDIEWTSTLPSSSMECEVSISTQLAGTEVQMGGLLGLHTTIQNTQNKGLPMAMAKLGIPGGLSAQPWQLKELQEKGIIDFYETTPNYVVCYFRDMAPNETCEIHLDLKAEIPGFYEAPASSAYLYYTAEFKDWKQVQDVRITP